MFLDLLLLLIILVLVLLLLAARKKGAETQGGDEPLPQFPIPRPTSTYVDPPRQTVTIHFDEAEGTVRLEPSTLVLAPNQQAAWKSEAGKIEIRFNTAESPFGGTKFTSARGGVSLSGIPRGDARKETPREYLVLFTAPDGRLFRQTAAVVISSKDPNGGKLG